MRSNLKAGQKFGELKLIRLAKRIQEQLLVEMQMPARCIKDRDLPKLTICNGRKYYKITDFPKSAIFFRQTKRNLQSFRN